MIYDIDIPDNLMQGDILRNLPKISVDSLEISEEELAENTNFWNQLSASVDFKHKIWNATVSPTYVCGIILSQTCDLRKDKLILIAEIRNPRINFSPNKNKKYHQIQNILKTETRQHYLPKDIRVDELKQVKIIDFTSLFFIPFNFIYENIKRLFVARIIDDAHNVLKEKISRFFTRLEYDEPIFLDDDEVETWREEAEVSDEEYLRMKKILDTMPSRKTTRK